MQDSPAVARDAGRARLSDASEFAHSVKALKHHAGRTAQLMLMMFPPFATVGAGKPS